MQLCYNWNFLQVILKDWVNSNEHLLYIRHLTQQTFQRCLNVVVRLICCREVEQRETNVETTLCMQTLKFTTLNNVESTLSISTLILTTLDNVVTALQTRPFAKNWKEQKYVWAFEEKQWNWICWTLSLDCYFKIFLTLLPTLREIKRRIFAKPRKILMMSWKCCITRTVFKPFHYAKYWLAFN